MSAYPILIIGAGPIGLAAAAKCAAQKLDFLVLEAGSRAAFAIRDWAHVRLFSPWSECLDADSVALLARQGWSGPDPEAYPTGAELIDRYLTPLAAQPEIADRLRLKCRIVRYWREGDDKTRAACRPGTPFVAVASSGETFKARAIIDASGTWRTPVGLPCTGLWKGKVHSRIPDLTKARVRTAFAGKRALVIGSGHSAMTSIVSLATNLAGGRRGRILWIRRSTRPAAPSGPKRAERSCLERSAAAAVEQGLVEQLAGLSITGLVATADSIRAVGQDSQGGDITVEADVAIVATGFRPDLSLGGGLRLTIDPRWEASGTLAEIVDPERHSCGSVPPHGASELRHEEPDFFIVGAKSYGRAPNFLLATGYGQLDSVIPDLDRSASTGHLPAATAAFEAMASGRARS